MSQSKYDPRQLIIQDLKKLQKKYLKQAERYKSKVCPKPINLVDTRQKYLQALEARDFEEAKKLINRYHKAVKQIKEPVEKVNHYIKMEIMCEDAAAEIGNMIFHRQLKEGQNDR